MTQETLFVTSAHMKIQEIKPCLQQWMSWQTLVIQTHIQKYLKWISFSKQNTLGRPILLEVFNLTLTRKNM